MILLPNRELMQAHFVPAVDNSFCMRQGGPSKNGNRLDFKTEQFLNQDGPTLRCAIRQLPGLDSSLAGCFPDRSRGPVLLSLGPGQSTL
jgi:hypothetical protein